MTAWPRLLLPAGVTLSRSEGSGAMGVQMLRGVYPECNEWAQDDSAATYADTWINVFIYIDHLTEQPT
jgi:hypothetical protein